MEGVHNVFAGHHKHVDVEVDFFDRGKFQFSKKKIDCKKHKHVNTKFPRIITAHTVTTNLTHLGRQEVSRTFNFVVGPITDPLESVFGQSGIAYIPSAERLRIVGVRLAPSGIVLDPAATAVPARFLVLTGASVRIRVHCLEGGVEGLAGFWIVPFSDAAELVSILILDGAVLWEGWCFIRERVDAGVETSWDDRTYLEIFQRRSLFSSHTEHKVGNRFVVTCYRPFGGVRIKEEEGVVVCTSIQQESDEPPKPGHVGSDRILQAQY